MDINTEEYFLFMPREILTEVILKDFTESELIPLSLVCKSFWQLFDGAKLHFHLGDFCPLTINLVEFFRKTKVKTIIRNNLCSAAAKHGNLELLQWARSNDYIWGDTSLVASKYGQLKVLEWAYANGCSIQKGATSCAAKEGHLQILQWIHSKNIFICASAAMLAAKNGYINIVKWIVSDVCGVLKLPMIYKAVKYNQIEIVQYLLITNIYLHYTIYVRMIEYGRLSMLKWAHDQGYEFHCMIYADAVNMGKIEIIEWLESIGYGK